MMREPATVDERAPLLRGAGSGFNRRGASIRGCLDDVSRVASNRWFRAAMVAKSAFFTLGTVILLHHGTSMSTGRTRREGNGYLEVPAEAHFAPLWSGDHLRHHPAADDLNVAWFPVHRGRFVMDQAAERAKDAARGGNHAKDDRMPKWPKHVIGGDDWADLGVVAMSGAFGGAREKQPEFWFHAVPGDVPVVSMDVRGHGESERGWNALSVDDAFDAVRWNLMANDVLAVADDAKFRRIVLVGSSMTTSWRERHHIASLLTEHYPDVRRLSALAESAGLTLSPPQGFSTLFVAASRLLLDAGDALPSLLEKAAEAH